MTESLRPEICAEFPGLRAGLRTGLRAWFYRGRRRARRRRVGHLATGVALFYAVYLR